MRRKSESDGVKSRLVVCLTAVHTNPQGREVWRESDTKRARVIKTTIDLREHMEPLYFSDDEDVTVRHDADGYKRKQPEYT